MKIIYFTSALSDIDFQELNKLWVNGINPSHQYFHNRFIRMLALNDSIIVVSKRPFSRSKCSARALQQRERIEGNIRWFYLGIPRFKTLRSYVCRRSSKKFLKTLDLKDAVIFSDILNPYISFIAKGMSRKYKIPAIGIIRESPSNIVGTTKAYAERIFSQSHDYDGYICVTKEIDETINPNHRPSIIIEGLVEDPAPYTPNENGERYIFYTGSLQEKYGIYNLIKAFKEINDDNLSLFLVGQPNKSTKFSNAIKNDKRIKVLGFAPNEKVLELERSALCCVNPSPYTEDLNRFCFPQKTLEYLSNCLTVTTRNTKLQNTFQDCCIFHDGKTVASLKESIEHALNMSEEEKEKIVSSAKKKVNELYALTPVRKKVYKFAKQFIK